MTDGAEHHDRTPRFIPRPLSRVSGYTIAVFGLGWGAGMFWTGLAMFGKSAPAVLFMVLSLNFIIPSAVLYWIKR